MSRSAMRGGAAILVLLAASACQQSPQPSGQGGMFTGVGNKQEASSANTAQPAAAGPATTPAPTPAPGMVPAAPAAVAPPIENGAQPPAAEGAARTEDRRVRIVNRSGQIIREIRGSPSNQRSYGEDRIPQGVLPDGGNVIVDFNDGNGECVYDLLVLLQDGSRRDQGGVNVCRVSEFTVLPTGSSMR